MDWWTIVKRCRATENTAYVVAANQAARLSYYPPYSWSGGSQIVDFEGRLLADASPGPGERIVVARLCSTGAKFGAVIRCSRIFAQRLIRFIKNIFIRRYRKLTMKIFLMKANNNFIDESKRLIASRAENSPEKLD